MPTCAVCGADVEQESVGETDYREESYAETQVEYEGDTYVFCSEEHRRAFEADPGAYA